ncbi:TetR/AcrR family transcriptional regulator [Faunimonas sp. B44]|uniref:TetR/AcrR family transcriptional regulator n=1 Tax=Faunimonas sp. B44 TaxID=3461493 RepID=UPI004043EFB0
MPRTVDHDQRRSVILKAFIAVAARAGLHAVSLRAVAAEAGVSLRLVQYYFDTKAGLMQSGLTYLEDVSNKRLMVRLQSSGRSPTARRTLEALFAVALPTDVESRQFHLLWTSYAMLAMTDPDISDRTFVDSPMRLHERIASILEYGKAEGEFSNQIDHTAEASILVALIHGLGTAVLVGQQSTDTAYASFTYHLDGLAAKRSAHE